MFYSVIITYYPEISHLISMVVSHNKAGIPVVIFDNSPDENSVKDISSQLLNNSDNQLEFLLMGDGCNYGLGSAFNKSVKRVRDMNKDVMGILFFDQDSTPTPSSLVGLINQYEYLREQNVAVGVLGALPIDSDEKPYRLEQSEKQMLNFKNKDFMFAEFVISSFSLVPCTTFDKIGLFDEKLFIDLVDNEFSFRCRKNGLFTMVSKLITFPHIVGESRKSFFGRKYAISSPIRNYYQARNLILVSRDYGWYFYPISKISLRFVQVFLSSIYCGSFFKRYYYFFKGIYHGLTYRGGMYK